MIVRKRHWWEIGLVAAPLAVGFIVLLAALLVPQGTTIRQALFAKPIDGTWMATEINGQPVPAEEYRITVRQGQVTAGRDGCNDWSFDDSAPPGPDGSRMIVSTLQGCPETPLERAYWAMIHKPVLQPLKNGQLSVSGARHHARFVRCEWQRVIEQSPGYTSDVMRCLPVH